MEKRQFYWWLHNRQLKMKSLIKIAQNIVGSEEPKKWFPVYASLYDKHMEGQ